MTPNKTHNCDVEVIDLRHIEAEKIFRQELVFLQFLSRIVCIDDSADNYGRYHSGGGGAVEEKGGHLKSIHCYYIYLLFPPFLLYLPTDLGF